MLRKLFKNKIVLYMSTRYITYILTFIVNMLLASKLGPANYGIWSFLMLVFWYFNIFDFGVPSAIQIMLVQNKTNVIRMSDIEKTGNVLISLLALVCFIVAIYYCVGGIKKAHDLNLGWMFYVICVCGLFNYFCILYDKIYRVKNRLFELAFKQTSVVFFLAVAVFCLNNRLLEGLVISYLAWCLSSFFVFYFRGGLDFSGRYDKVISKEVLKKGFFLFVFHSGFSFIIIITKTIVSAYYSLEEFGLFSFAYYLGHVVYSCLLAFSTIVITKLLDRFHSPDKNIVISTIYIVRENYVKLFHGIIYLSMVSFPIILYFMPKYSSTLPCMLLCSLMMLCYTNSFGYSTYLMAVNKEKKLAFISVSSLMINLVLGLLIVHIHAKYDYIVFGTMIAYLNFAVMCTYYGRKELNLPTSLYDVFTDCFPLSLLIPFSVAFLIALINIQWVLIIPFFIFVIINVKSIKSIFFTTKKLLNNPKLIDI